MFSRFYLHPQILSSIPYATASHQYDCSLHWWIIGDSLWAMFSLLEIKCPGKGYIMYLSVLTFSNIKRVINQTGKKGRQLKPTGRVAPHDVGRILESSEAHKLTVNAASHADSY